MKVKFLLFPLSIVIAVALSIFWIQPEISSAISLRPKKENAKQRLEQIERVISNIDALDQSLNENIENERFAETYIPQSVNDDRIIDALNFFAGESGLFLASAGLERVSSEIVQSAEQSVQATSEQEEVKSVSPGSYLSNFGGAETAGDLNVFVSSSPSKRVRSTEVSLSVFGKYEQIKTFIERVYRANHFQEFISIEVRNASQGSSTSEGVAVTPDMLNASIEIRFSSLSKTTAEKGVLLDAFNKTEFDFAVIQSLRDRATNIVPPLEAVPSVRQNPFLR